MRVAVPAKYFVDEIGLQADRVEDLRAAIGLIGRDAHLGHHLEHALADRLDVALDDFVIVELLGQLGLHRDEGLEGEIGVDRLGAVAGEAGEMMHLARLAGFDDKADRGAQARADQMMMHGGAGAAATGSECGPSPTMRSDRMMMLIAVAHRALRRARRARRAPARMPAGAVAGVEGDVERARLKWLSAIVGDRADLLQVGVGQDRLAHFEPLGLCAVPSRSNRFGRGPMIETRLMTSSSRIGSIGGLVTCAKFCLK